MEKRATASQTNTISPPRQSPAGTVNQVKPRGNKVPLQRIHHVTSPAKNIKSNRHINSTSRGFPSVLLRYVQNQVEMNDN